MNEHQISAPTTRVESFEYDDRTVIAVDLGPGTAPAVDVVDGTAILVLDGEQEEFDLPAGAVQAVNSNGVVTFEVRE